VADKPEERARAEIDRLLAAAGWSVQSMSEINIHDVRRDDPRIPDASRRDFADWMLYEEVLQRRK
jgi:type I site-specific restriction endonuclease